MKYLKISEFAEVITGGTPSTDVKEYWDNGTIPWLQSGCCQNCYVKNASKYITYEGYNNSSTKMMPKNTVLIALTGATAGKIGFLTFEACGNQSITGICPNNIVEQKFLFYYLVYLRPKILSDCVGGAQPHISQNYVKNIRVPIYPREKQNEIINILNSILEMQSKSVWCLETFDELLKSKFSELFDEDEAGNTELGNVVNISSGDGLTAQSISESKTEEFKYVVYGANGTRGYYKEANRHGKCIMVGRVGALAGNVHYYDGDFFATEHALVLETKTKRVDPEWLYYDLLRRDLFSIAKGVAQPVISSSSLKKQLISEPPIEKQRCFLDFSHSVDILRNKFEKRLILLNEIYAKKTEEYFGGEE